MMTGLEMSPSIGRENREFASELKFLVPQSLGEQIRIWARMNLMADPHGAGEEGDRYRITSLYFDTDQFDVFHRRGSFGRSKYRIRRYGENESLFLERKLRTQKMLTKRRSQVALDELHRLLPDRPDDKWEGAWYHRRLLLRKLKPVCQIAYDRTARVLMTHAGPMRLTIDENVHAIPASEVKLHSMSDTRPLLESEMIIEVKYRLELPPLVKRVIEEFALNPTKCSKYRLAAQRLGLVPGVEGSASGNGHA